MSAWSNDQPINLTVPAGAGPTDSAVLLEGVPEPILQASGLAAAILFQYAVSGSRRAFVLAVEPDPGTGGEWHLFATDLAAPLFKRQFVDLTHSEDGSGQMALCAGTALMLFAWDAGATFPRISTSTLYSFSVDAGRIVLNPGNLLINGKTVAGPSGIAWTSYSPSWSGSGGTQPALGNGTITGRYRYLWDDLILAEVVLTAGSTTTFGNGVYFLDIPVTAGASEVGHGIGEAAYLDAGTKEGGGIVKLETTGKIRIVPAPAAGAVGDNWSNTVPFAWGSGDVLRARFIYSTT